MTDERKPCEHPEPLLIAGRGAAWTAGCKLCARAWTWMDDTVPEHVMVQVRRVFPEARVVER